jgi:hypothetical protein
MEHLIQKRLKKEMQEGIKGIDKRLESIKDRSNEIINSLFDKIAMRLIQFDAFLIPLHGIPQPEKENPMNLFKR